MIYKIEQCTMKYSLITSKKGTKKTLHKLSIFITKNICEIVYLLRIEQDR